MKKKLGILLCLGLLSILLTSCDEILSVVTKNENGEKVVNNYVSMYGETVYDEESSLESWKDIRLSEGEKLVEEGDSFFTILNKKENIVICGDKDAAIELSFFDGGYKYTFFTSAANMQSFSDSLFKF